MEGPGITEEKRNTESFVRSPAVTDRVSMSVFVKSNGVLFGEEVCSEKNLVIADEYQPCYDQHRKPMVGNDWPYGRMLLHLRLMRIAPLPPDSISTGLSVASSVLLEHFIQLSEC